MRLDSYFTKEEFIKSIDEHITDDDIRMMFDYANMKKDEQVLLNNDDYEEFSTKNKYMLDIKNILENFKDISFNENPKDKSFKLRRPVKPYRYKEKFVA